MKPGQTLLPRLLWIFLGLTCLGLIVHALHYGYVVDDAFISFRYAQNLIRGHGPVYNPGEKVEGYTNFLWVMTAALGMELRADPVRWSRTIGLLCAAGILLLAFAWPRPETGGGGPLRLLAPALLCISPVFALWSAGGLETALFTFLVSAGFFAGLRAGEGRTEGRWDVVSGLCLGLAVLARPDGILAVLVVALDRALWPPRGGTRRARFSLVFLVTCAAVIVPYEIWRWTYYGHVFPNSYYAKVGWTGAQVWRGVRYAGGFAAGFAWAAALLALVGSAVGLRQRSVRLLSLWVVLYVAYTVAVGGDGLVMYRFFVPVLPALYLLAERGVRVAVNASSNFSPGLGRWTGAVLCVLLGILTVKPAVSSPEEDAVRQDRQFVMHWTTIGKWLRSYARPGESIAVTTAGAVPFYSGLTTIDMLGINDPVIAHRKMPDMGVGTAGHEKYDMAYVIDRRPTYLFHHLFLLTKAKFTREQFETPWNPGEADLLTDGTFARLYEPVSERIGDYYINFFRLKKAAGGDAE